MATDMTGPDVAPEPTSGPRHLGAPAPRRGIIGAVRPRRSGPGTEADADLDDLFQAWEPEPSGPPQLDSRPWLVISILQAFAASAVVYTTFRAFDLAPSYLLIAAVCAGLVLVRQSVLVAREPRWQRTRDLVRGQGGAPVEARGDGDGMLNAIGRWDRRLDWGATTGERFTSAVARRIGEIADERLRQRHALNRASDPVRARELLGEDAWALIHGQVGGSPEPAMVARAVARIEAL